MRLSVDIGRKSYPGRNGEPKHVLGPVAFDVEPGCIVALYGKSGIGKSTLLKIVSGLDESFEGNVTIGGAPVHGPTRRIGVVSQSPVSYEWLTVAQNIGFGLRYKDNGASPLARVLGWLPSHDVAMTAERMARIVGLEIDDLDKYPQQLSGGMQQRMAFGRALVAGPDVLVADEPFSALDYESRYAMQDMVRRSRDELGTSFLCVSHDPEEVLYLSDQIIVLGDPPAQIIRTLTPGLPLRGTPEFRFTGAFQAVKRELMALIAMR